jgi:hypothetical protein
VTEALKHRRAGHGGVEPRLTKEQELATKANITGLGWGDEMRVGLIGQTRFKEISPGHNTSTFFGVIGYKFGVIR